MEAMDITTNTPAVDMSQRWAPLENMLSRPSPFGNETGKLPNGEFEPSPDLLQDLRQKKVLVIGAGGLGCEILKNLALSGLTNIHCIDLDTIDVTNINRQFLFRNSDVGRPKAEVAAEFIMNRIPTCHVTPYHTKIQNFDREFYSDFGVIVAGLDNVEARRWLNNMLVSMVEIDEDDGEPCGNIVPFIDGGTEGFRGQARVIIPMFSACFECTIGTFPPKTTFPLCTITNTPRLPEHCITYVYMLEWEQTFPDRKIDTDNPNDMQWIYHKALQRAQKFGIEGVTYFLTLGVVKNVIPAIASTNAVIAAACCNEAFKLLSYASQSMNTYMMYMGSEGLSSTTFNYEKSPDCLVCSNAATRVNTAEVSRETMTLEDFITTHLIENPDRQLANPSLKTPEVSLYFPNPKALEVALRPNLQKLLSALIKDGDVITIQDDVLGGACVVLSNSFQRLMFTNVHLCMYACMHYFH